MRSDHLRNTVVFTKVSPLTFEHVPDPLPLLTRARQKYLIPDVRDESKCDEHVKKEIAQLKYNELCAFKKDNNDICDRFLTLEVVSTSVDV